MAQDLIRSATYSPSREVTAEAAPSTGLVNTEAPIMVRGKILQSGGHREVKDSSPILKSLSQRCRWTGKALASPVMGRPVEGGVKTPARRD